MSVEKKTLLTSKETGLVKVGVKHKLELTIRECLEEISDNFSPKDRVDIILTAMSEMTEDPNIRSGMIIIAEDQDKTTSTS